MVETPDWSKFGVLMATLESSWGKGVGMGGHHQTPHLLFNDVQKCSRNPTE